MGDGSERATASDKGAVAWAAARGRSCSETVAGAIAVVTRNVGPGETLAI
jgi:hypothetical protein